MRARSYFLFAGVGPREGNLPVPAPQALEASNMYINEGNTVVKRMIAFRNEAPKENGGMPCGACREFFMQFAYENRDMEIMADYESRKTVLLKDLVPNWWGDDRLKNNLAK